MQKLQLSQNQSQKLSPQQIQFIRLLQLSNSNIESEIKKEIEENPALEENEKRENLETDSSDNYNYYQKSSNDISNFNRESNISNTESFRENLLTQLNFQKLDENEKMIANQIIGTLDNDGYLRRDIGSIIDDIAFTENIEFNNSEIKNVLLKIQNLEPAGIGARNLEECLLLQIDSIEEITEVQLLAKKIIIENFKEFKNKKGKPKINIQRFKGLGEMNPSQLRETVMDPNTRQLVRLSVSATDNANAMMDLLLSKKNAPARKEWLEKKGSLVRM